MARSIIAIALAAALSGCFTIGDADEPITTITVPAPAPNDTPEAVIVLPGFGDSASRMQDRGFAEAVQRAWPQVDVVLTNTTFAYYNRGVLVPRLEQDVMAPALKRYKKLWLAGASMGGSGTLLYEHEHEGQMQGLLLFAPFLGDKDLLEEVRAAGGVTKWDPGPRPDALSADNWQRELWRVLKARAGNPVLAKRTWLICGKEDKLLAASRLASEALPASQYFEVEGGHKWEAWSKAAEATLPRIRASGTP